MTTREGYVFLILEEQFICKGNHQLTRHYQIHFLIIHPGNKQFVTFCRSLAGFLVVLLMTFVELEKVFYSRTKEWQVRTGPL